MKDPYRCDDCPHKIECIKEWGEEEYSAVIGTHHCLRSWDGFKNLKKIAGIT